MKLAVYGTLRRDSYNSVVIERARGVFIKTFIAEGLAVYKVPGLRYPIANLDCSSSAVAELYEIPENCIGIIDHFEGYYYPTQLRRCLFERVLLNTDIYCYIKPDISNLKGLVKINDWMEQ